MPQFIEPIAPLYVKIEAANRAFGNRCIIMFYRFKQISVTTRLRGLTLMSALTMLCVVCAMQWSGYQQRLADRQSSAQQAVALAQASMQWAYGQKQLGAINMAQAQKQALMALDRMRYEGGDYVWVNDLNQRVVHHAIKPLADDLQSAVAMQMLMAVGVVGGVSLLLWSGLELTARDLPAVRTPAAPTLYAQPAPYSAQAVDVGVAEESDQTETPAQMVSRLRMAGAI